MSLALLLKPKKEEYLAILLQPLMPLCIRYIYVCGARCLRPPPPARWYESQIPGLLLLLASALAAALAAQAAEAAAAGWLAAGPCLIERKLWKS